VSETDSTVRLRPLELDDLELLWAERETGVPAGHEAAARERLRVAVKRAGRLENGRLDLAVEARGRLVGQVEARQPVGAMPSGVFEIGISILEAERGRGYGRAAVAALTELLVREHDAHRVQASTDVENAAMRAVLERLGFSYEGVLRGFMPTGDGGRADFALYAVTRSDWDTRRS
jgi:RimJ/RimL family protein N-acetyltransferase